jgi:outer membrane protein OmpA-like peptidoglycan-associated protein
MNIFKNIALLLFFIPILSNAQSSALQFERTNKIDATQLDERQKKYKTREAEREKYRLESEAKIANKEKKETQKSNNVTLSKPKYSVNLFDGVAVLEYDDIQLLKRGENRIIKNEIDNRTGYEKYMIFQIFRGEIPIIDIKIKENSGYFIEDYKFIDNDFGELIKGLSQDNQSYFMKVCKEIFITHPIIHDQSVFDWSKLLKVQNLEAINSPYEDFAPMLSGDGSVLFFLRIGDPENSLTFIPTNTNHGKPLYFYELNEEVMTELKATGRDNPTARKEALQAQKKHHLKSIRNERQGVIKTGSDLTGENVNNSTFDSDIMIARKNKGRFTGVIREDFPLNDWSSNFFVGISSDGKRIYTEHKDLGSAYDVKEADPYSFMEYVHKSRSLLFEPNGHSISFEKSHNVFQVTYFMTLNNNAILCGFQGDDTKGKGDIYISFRQPNGQFEYPVNIGSDINSSLDEASPFLAADLQTLYFRRAINEKETKIFVSRRLDDSWKKWSEPVALPAPINLPLTINSDPFVTADGKTLYFASDRKRGTDRDIYSVELDDFLAPIAAPLVKGNVVNQGIMLEDVKVEVQAINDDSNKKQDISYAQSNSDGSYETPFRDGEKVAIKATKKGYISEVVISDNPAELQRDLEMTKLEKGNRFSMKNILFERAKSTFLKVSMPELENLKNVLLENPNLRILVEGHTDSTGKPTANQTSLEEKAQKLSEKRAFSVKDYLTKNGIDPTRIEIKGLGSSRPRYANDTEINRKKNRRVEVLIL